MLSVESKEVIRATLPAVGGAIGDITPLFYEKLFAAAPELERNLFNRGNQQGQQQKALAGAIATFATLQVEPDQDKIDATVSRIANKHASLGVAAESYDVVHKYLFEAIVEVLGEAVTPEVAAAWDELYWLFARTLIAAEAGLYEAAGVSAGDVWRGAVVSARSGSEDRVSFTLAAADGSPLPDFQPGQYISVAAQLPDGARQIRQYPLDTVTTDGVWAFTVRRVADSTLEDGTPSLRGEVSNFLIDHVSEGAELTVSLPFGGPVTADGVAATA